jgi:O-antigen ligase
MRVSTIIKIVFIYILVIQTINLIVGVEFNNYLIFNFTFFELGILAGLLLLAFKSNDYLKNASKDPNRIIILLIVVYFIYQVLIIAPQLFVDGYSIKRIAYAVFDRSYFLMIPLFYLWLLPSFKSLNTPIQLIQLSGVVVFIFVILSYLQGNVGYTSTGELRIAAGVMTIIFCFLLVTSFSFFSRKETNYFLVLVSLVGLVFSNHKSAYLGILAISIFALINIKRMPNKSILVLHTIGLLFLIMIPLTQVSVVYENFIGRVSTSFGMDDPNAKPRIVHYKMAWETFLENPVNGTMTNSNYYENLEKDNPPPHSFIFQILATQGIVGFLMLSAIFGSILWVAYKNRRDPFSFQMFLVIIFYLVFTSLNANFFSPRNIHILNFASALILYRHNSITKAKNVLVPLLTKRFSSEGIKKVNAEDSILEKRNY